jgi:hypothetical protein
MSMRWLAVVVAVAGIAGASPSETLAADSGTFTKSFTLIGTEQSFVVPAGVTAIGVHAVGGFGGVDFGALGFAGGGAGGMADAVVAVTPGETLYVEVGGVHRKYVPSDGFNGGTGTGGGGASDVRTIPRAQSGSLDSRLVVAGGGGGGGANGGPVSPCLGDPPGGFGGSAGQAGTAGSGDASTTGGGGGQPGTASAGGAGGSGGAPGGVTGQPGVKGQGGDGATGDPHGLAGGGGGGGGYYGGGGGGSGGSSGCIASTGGGGGGSSYAPGGTTGVDTSRTLPFVTLTWSVAPAPAPTLRVDLRGARPQLLTEKKSISVIVGCGPVACTIGASGSVRVPGRKAMRLRSRHAMLSASRTARLRLPTSKALRAAVRHAIRRHHTVTVKIAISATAPGAATVRRDAIIRVRAPRAHRAHGPVET